MAREIGIPVIHIEDFTTCDLQGHEALLAKRYADEGKSGAEISELLSKLIRTSGTLILPNDIQHLEKSMYWKRCVQRKRQLLMLWIRLVKSWQAEKAMCM